MEYATCHIGNKYLLKVDIKSFFPSISTARIAELFKSLGVASEIATLTARFITIGGQLPLGLATSPAVTNAICMPLDQMMEALSEKTGTVYTRYADDITFSGNEELPDLIDVTNVVEGNGFQLANEKTRYSKIGQAHYVTGLSISDKTAPHAPKPMKRGLRQELYFAKKNGLVDHLEHLGIVEGDEQQCAINRLDGLVKYISHHEPLHADKLHQLWSAILIASGESPSFTPKNRNRSPIYMYFDETEMKWEGNSYLALGVSVSQHQELITRGANLVLRDYLANPWSDGKPGEIQKKGLHFSDATEDLRKTYIEKLQTLPFRGYVSYMRLPSAGHYEGSYIRLLEAIIRRRLIAADGYYALLCFEENSKVSECRVRSAVDAAFERLKAENNRRPYLYKIEFVSKDALGVSVPDFLLGVMRRYLCSKKFDANKPTPREHIMFERLRDKFGVVLDVDSGMEYSRRNPLIPWCQ